MIFVTVGHTDPFDRLVEAIDKWAQEHPEYPVTIQIGNGAYTPRHCHYVRFLTPREYRERFTEARLVVAHAGMGSVITALELQKIIVLLPRLPILGEARNDHQLATVQRWRNVTSVLVAESEMELTTVLNDALERLAKVSPTESRLGSLDVARPLIRFIQDFVSQNV